MKESLEREMAAFDWRGFFCWAPGVELTPGATCRRWVVSAFGDVCHRVPHTYEVCCDEPGSIFFVAARRLAG